MDTLETSTISPEAPPQSALTELEALSTEQAAAIPSPDGDRDDSSDADRQPEGVDTAEVQPSDDAPAKKKPRFKIGAKPAEESVTECPPAAESGSAPDTGIPAQPVASLAKRTWRTCDRFLDAINRPFEWLGDRARSVLGYVALVTLAVAILAMVLTPLFFRRRDAIRFLQDKRSQSLTVQVSPGEAGGRTASPDDPHGHAMGVE